MPKTATAVKRMFFCPHCDKPYEDCEHTKNKDILPKEETGRIISSMEFIVLLDAGEI